MDPFERGIVELLPRLRRFARALAGHPADADDLCQIAVERALARREQWVPGTRLDNWVMRIVKNAWIDEARSRTRKGRLFEGPEAGERVADGAVAAPAVRDDAMAVSQAMARLPDDQRLAVALVLVEGLSYAEAGEVMETPPGTVASRVARGRMALMAQLEAGG
ncbi:MAG TPA: RNA polymerase sigma factor [Caulobacter sp.]|nr:RNA polymerase sigma factor [Caulobacter sp.]